MSASSPLPTTIVVLINALAATAQTVLGPSALSTSVAATGTSITIGNTFNYWNSMPSDPPPGGTLCCGQEFYEAQVGDKLVFHWDNYHNIVVANTEADYNNCGQGTEVAGYTHGGGTIKGNQWEPVLTAPGELYFFCAPHCTDNQKIKVRVTCAAGDTSAACVSPTPSPPPPSPPPEMPTVESSDPCFPSGAVVMRAGGQHARVHELREGDELLAVTRDGRLTTDVVSLLSLADAEAQRRFVTLTTAANQTLTLTASHHVPVGASCCSMLMQAQDVAVGDAVWLVTAGSSLSAARVLRKGTSGGSGLFSPVLTRGSLPVVDGFVTSFDSTSMTAAAGIGLPSLLATCKLLGACDMLRRVAFAAERKYVDGFGAGTR